MGSVGTGSAGADSADAGSPNAGSPNAGSVDADSTNAGRERLARYGLTGPENQAAVDAGLAGGAWFRSAVPRKRMKELMERSDYPAVRDTIIWLGLILALRGLGITFWLVWHGWWAVPFFLAYGVLVGSTSDSRWHESGHGTAFKTRWIDEGLYQLASFMIIREPINWPPSHARHFTDALVRV